MRARAAGGAPASAMNMPLAPLHGLATGDGQALGGVLPAAEILVDPADDRVVEANAPARRLLCCDGRDLAGLALRWLAGDGAGRVAVTAGDGGHGWRDGDAGASSFPYTAVVVKRAGRTLLRLRLEASSPRAGDGDGGAGAGRRVEGSTPEFRRIVGGSPAVRHLLRQVELVAPTGATVLITGESGTGKELIAHAIHGASDRADGPMVRVNCAAVPRELFESEFFGHVKGAFTGAAGERAGRFELADGGTLFLDEVGEIPLELQGKLLRVLQEGQLERVGEGRTRRVDVRVVAATNRDLHHEVAERRFREDLYYRLNVYPIHAVPLRERPEDIPLLASHFLLRAAHRLNVRNVRLTQEDIRHMQAYPWPGNVRELENVVERGVIAATDGRLALQLEYAPAACSPVAAPVARAPAGEEGDDGLMGEAERRRRDREMIERALERTGGKVFGPGGAAELLGVKPTTLASRIKRMGIERRERD